MKTQIKQWGDSLIIVLNRDFIKLKNLKLGDWVDLEDIVKILPFEESNKEMLNKIKKEVKK